MTYVRDFLGNYIMPGNFVVYPGAGNRKAEYGMILMKVKSVEDDKDYTGHGRVECERLNVRYSRVGDKNVAEAYLSKSIITNTNKLIAINSSTVRDEVYNWFNKIDFTEEESRRIGEWIHGQKKTF